MSIHQNVNKYFEYDKCFELRVPGLGFFFLPIKNERIKKYSEQENDI